MADRDDRPRPERYDPLPNLLLLPVVGWRKLSPRGRIAVAALAAAALAALIAAWPQVERDKRAGAEQRAREARQSRAERRRELVEDQRPRRAQLPPATRDRVRDRGGLVDPAAAALAGAALERAIASDVRARIRAGKLNGPLLETRCDPLRQRTARGTGYNCFAFTARTRSGERVLESGYRFSARAELPATLVWCKENPRPLHPTSYVISVPISPECR
jgi:hypothetical protein